MEIVPGKERNMETTYKKLIEKTINKKYCLYDNKKKLWFGYSYIARKHFHEDARWFVTPKQAKGYKKIILNNNAKLKHEDISIVLITNTTTFKEVK